MAAKYNSTWGFNNPNDNLPDDIEIWIDCFNNVQESKSKIKFFVNIEPNEIMHLNNEIINNSKLFDYILCYDDEILKNTSNSVLFEYGTKWVDMDLYTFPEKNFCISTVCGHKTFTKNHIIRKDLWYNQDKIKIPCDFYISQYGGVDIVNNNKILKDSKFPLFESMFHICIENTTKNNFFTEKLIDCLLCKSIPIYIGCPNINNYFNTEGFIIANSTKDVISKCNDLTPDFYYSKLNIIEYNYKKALECIDYNSRLTNKIKNILNI